MAMMTLYARQQKKDTHVYSGLLDSGEGEGGMIWENGIETCIIGSSFIHLMRTDSNVFFLMAE